MNASQQDSPTPPLTESDKIYGLSKIWEEASYNFAYFDQVPDLDWDAAYRDYIPQVLEAKSTVDYYRTLQKFCALLQDLHTGVFPPEEFYEAFDRPNIILKNVQKKAIAINTGRSLYESLPRGSEIISVDDIPTETYLCERIFPYISSSTQHTRWDIGIRNLLDGPVGTSVAIAFRTREKEERTLTVDRRNKKMQEEWHHPQPDMELFEFKWLEERIPYIALNSFKNNLVAENFRQKLPELQTCKGIVLDLRQNGGGTTTVANPILKHLIDRPVRTSKWKTRQHRAAYKAWGKISEKLQKKDRELLTLTAPGFLKLIDEGKPYLKGTAWYERAPSLFRPSKDARLTCPMVILIGERTCSAAESFLVPLVAIDRIKFVGTKTVGSTGQPLIFDLPGGGAARICTVRPVLPDGCEFVGYGISPDVCVEPTVEEVLDEKDVTREKGLEVLKQMLT